MHQGRGWLRIQAARRGLRLFRPGGPPRGEALLAGIRIEGDSLRIAGSKQPVWGALDVIRVGPGRLGVVNVLDLETYLQGVLIPEMGADFPLEALKAQAVAARTYALANLVRARKRGRKSLLRPTQADQVFRPVKSVPKRIRRAVDETRGQVIGTLDAPITTYYHSTCGGSTRDAAPWFSPSSPLRGRPCRFCRSSPYYRWERRYDLKKLTRALRAERAEIVPPIRAFRLSKDRTGHTVRVVVIHKAGATPISGTRFRVRINRSLARSRSERLLSVNLESIRLTAGGKVAHVKGRGWGHGVGMCQFGAARLAGRGLDYREILAFYYGRRPLTHSWGDAP
jgi:stage II sporulation protein D